MAFCKKYFTAIAFLAILAGPQTACSQNKRAANQQPASLRILNGIWALDWSPDDKYIAMGGDDSLLWIYDISKATLHKTIPMPNMVRNVAWQPGGNLLLVSTKNTVALLNIETGQSTPLKGRGGARAMTWNYDGSLLATGNGDAINIWDSKGNFIRSLKKENNMTYLTMDWHPSRNILVTGSDDIRIFDADNGNQLKVINHRKENLAILTVKWHPSGEFFVSGDYGHYKEGKESYLQFWKEDGTLIKTMLGSKGEYRNVRWNKDGSVLATGSDALRFWTKNGELLTGTPSQEEDVIWSIDWNSKGEKIITATGNGVIMLWDSKGKPVQKIH